MAYTTPSEAASLLADFGINTAPTRGALDLASRQLDSLGPFIGTRFDALQSAEFPRSVTVTGDTVMEVPQPIKLWTALQAHRIVTNEEPALTSISIPQVGSKSYATPKGARAAKLQQGLLDVYLRKTATLGFPARRYYYGGPLNNVPYV